MALKTLQNFYKATVATAWAAGTGNRYVDVLPSPSSGTLVINPSNTSKREIVNYSAKGTDGGGNYITLSTRGVGGTSDQTHAVGESVRMNITAEMYTDIQTELDLKLDDSVIDTDGTLAANSDSLVASQKATKTYSMPLSYLDADGTLAANSDTKVATQKAVKTYADALAIAGAPNASETVKGIVEIATQGEYDAGTDTGGTGAALVVPPSIIKAAITAARPVTTTLIPKTAFETFTYSNIGHSTNTSLYYGLVDIKESITVNKIVFYVNGFTAAGTTKVALYSLDGQTKVFEGVSGTVSAGGAQVTITLGAPVAVTAGKYYLATLNTGTANYEISTQSINASIYGNLNAVSGEYYYSGIKTVTASTIPATIDPTTISSTDANATMFCRFEN